MTFRAISNIGYSGGGIGLKSAGILAQSAVPASVTGTTAETVLATISLPALLPNSVVRITHDHSCTNNANSKTITARINGSSVGAYVLASVLNSTAQRRISNRGVTNSQLITPATLNASFASSSSGYLVTSINTSNPSTLTLTGTLATSTDTLTLESYIVEILNP